MNAFLLTRPALNTPPVVIWIFRVLTLLLPAALMGLGALRTDGPVHTMLVLGMSFQVLVACLSFLSRQAWRAPIGPSVVALYLIGLGWMWLAASGVHDWYLHLAQSLLLVIPLVVFALQTLTNSGAPAIRRAQLLAERLAARSDWPADLAACRSLPDVKALREAVHFDATPALALLGHKRLEVRVAALAALEFRKNWRPGQAELVLHIAQRSPEPAVRAAAAAALANVDERTIVEALSEFLRDKSWEVRRAATEALLWDCERRWTWVRAALRITLADAIFQNDGPLRLDGQTLTPEAVGDLNAWAAEKGVIGIRAAQTLGIHYGRCLAEHPGEALISELKRQLGNSHTAPPLRMELARLLQANGHLDPDLLTGLLSPANPAPLRLLAVEALLRDGPHPEATSTLWDIARLPNRELALATAEVIQRRLGVDLGLPLGQPLPPIHSRPAAEVTRRVMQWASQQLADNKEQAMVISG